jgi:DNA-binding CsgD family transcriptional regulator
MHPFEILRDRGDPLLVFMTPHEANHGRFDLEPSGDDGAVIIIRTSDLRQNLAAQARVLELLWNLTPSQARLACLLSGGENLQSAATELGITEASARQYLKAVFQKLGVNRQGDMLRKVLSVLVSAKPDGLK